MMRLEGGNADDEGWAGGWGAQQHHFQTKWTTRIVYPHSVRFHLKPDEVGVHDSCSPLRRDHRKRSV